ncbi:carboxypeptidase family protein [Arcticibacter pallidicorallinus]|uniref:Carboxypeptidase family protein n=1 Tax=Arcticibacter pallidicorallinus TaxID=1259464 RepID=A0A2T0U7F7_9SPHI|nr:Ig-like domain-containing protein [Arcticibacter pallidicorallinus]PRY53853.1 carboxypeptidase family protein [Arcticibacter pallidicorallinus]
MRNTQFSVFFAIFLFIVVGFFFPGCASIQTPTGGPRDSVAPTVLKETPANFTTNFRAEEINIQLDEYFKISNESKEFSVSPAMDKNPFFKVRKKVLNIQLQDTLAPNTTYTINFGRGLVDYNEGNVLKNYMYVFSTGDKIDSLTITGTVTNTLSKKPVLDATVFIIPISQDSIFGKRRANIFTTTDSSGNFSLKYLRPDTYRVYALKEEGGDRVYNSPNEEIAFLSAPLVFTKDTTGIKLELFRQEAGRFRIVDRKIEKDGKIVYMFNQKLSKPGIRILHPQELNESKIVEFSRTNDTLSMWTEKMDFDSIQVAILNEGKDIDTSVIRRSKRDEYNRELKISDNTPSSRIKPGTDLVLTFSAPVGDKIDPSKVTFLQDSVSVGGLRIFRDTSSTRKYVFKYPWKIDRSYILKLDENAFTGRFGGSNKPFEKVFSRDEELNYGNLALNVSVPDTSRQYIVQLLNERDELLRENPISKNTVIQYNMYSVGKYRFRVIYDSNRNGQWDTGDVYLKKQPENVWNANVEITLRANWELEEKLAIPPET